MMRRRRAWVQLKNTNLPPHFSFVTTVSVIIPVRNESLNILNLLQNLATQSYPQNLLEVLIVDDYSEDNTAALVKNFANKAAFSLRYISLAEAGGNGKKAAVAAGVKAATGELLVFTDGDCRVLPHWLRYLVFAYTSQQARFISGPVCFEAPQTLFQKMQLVEFASLIGAGGSSIALGKPNMCNGANLAYPKSVFAAVKGFSGNEHIPSGDDEFLMHKVQALYPGRVFFLKAAEATVFTSAKSNTKDFFQQRVRWASKWPAYQSWEIKLLAILVFGLNLLLLLGAGLAVFNLISLPSILLAISIKIIVDLLFMSPVLHFFQNSKYLGLMIPLQFIYIPYVVITALMGLRSSYQWKGRVIKK